MGCFSWKFADTDNEKALNIDEQGAILCPDNTLIFEKCYEGYGEFNGQDVYNLVADWNREYLSAHPEFEISGKRIDDFEWYSAYADLSKSKEEIVAHIVDTIFAPEYRHIGISLACYDEQNAALPYPIKIVSANWKYGKYTKYANLPASKNDPEQGFGCSDDYDEHF